MFEREIERCKKCIFYVSRKKSDTSPGNLGHCNWNGKIDFAIPKINWCWLYKKKKIRTLVSNIKRRLRAI